MGYWWIDVILIAIVVIYAVIGLAKGFFESIIRLVSTGASLGLAIWLARPASELVNKVLPFVKWYTNALASQGDISLFGTVYSHEQVAGFLSIITTGAIIFVLVKVIFWILAKIFDSAKNKNTALSGLNRVLGLVFGLVKGGVMVLVLLGVLSLTSSLPFMEKVQNAVQQTTVTNWLYKYVDEFVGNNVKKLDLAEILNKTVDNANSSSESSAVISQGVTADGYNYTVEL